MRDREDGSMNRKMDGWMMDDERMQGIYYRRNVEWKDGWMKGGMGKRGTTE